MNKKKSKAWSNYGDEVQVVDVVFEVNKLDLLKKTEGKDSDGYKKQHEKTVKLITTYNLELGGRGKFGLSLSKTRHLIQLGADKEQNVEIKNVK